MKTNNPFSAGFICLCFFMSTVITPTVAAQAKLDITPPTVQHEPNTDNVPSNVPYLFTAKVDDENGVGEVFVFYRTIGTTVFSNIQMKEGDKSGVFMVELAASELKSPGIEYYIQAEDTAGNTLLRGFTFEPLVLNIDGSGPLSVAETNSTKSSGPLAGIASNKMVWLGLGVLVLGAVALGGSSGGSSDSGNTVTIDAPLPQ